mmetsp:Transcript_22707/g.29500  ORF Transcript_22707/g.29500 Transcript_22707/m.29500 type:complete len:247 (-) Transcript_22707:316-1056(-)
MIFYFGTCFITAASIGVSVYGSFFGGRVTGEKVGFSFDRVVKGKEYWRAVSAAFSHANTGHLVFNMVALWNLRSMEALYGTAGYLSRSMIIWVLSKLFYLMFMYPFSRAPNMIMQRQATVFTVGYSGALFGWMSAKALSPQAQPYVLFGGLVLQPHVASIFSMLLTQIIVPNSSFFGHLSGILAGYLVGSGALEWASQPYWTSCLLFWVLLLVAASLKATTSLKVPFVDYCNLTRAQLQPQRSLNI